MTRVLSAIFIALLLAWLPTAGRTAPVNVIEQPDPAANLTGTSLVLQAGLDRQGANENGLAALVAESILRTPVQGGESLEDAIAAQGGEITYAVEPRDVRFYLDGISSNYAALLQLFAGALASPDFSASTLGSARQVLDAKIAQAERSPLTVGIDMLNRAFYPDSAGMPRYGLPATLAVLGTSDAQAFYREHYRRGDAILSAAGNLDTVPSAAFSAVANALPAGKSAPVAVATPNPPSNTRELLARRDISVPWLVAQYPAPEVDSKDFGAMLILTAFMQRTLADVSEVPTIATRSPLQRGVGAYYNFDARPANVVIYVDGGLGDPTRTFATALTVVNVLGHAKLGGNLNELKAYAAGRFLQDTTTLQDRAWLAAVAASRGISGDFVQHALKEINGARATDVQRVAARYFGSPTIALVLPRMQQSVQTPTP